MSTVDDNDRIHLFDDLTLDLARGCVTRSGEAIHLRPRTYEVLAYLVENRGHLISKDKLIEDVWQSRAVTDGSLGKCIEELRGALGEGAKQYLRNVRGRGYILDTDIGRRTEIGMAGFMDQIDLVRVTIEEREQVTNVTSAFPANGSPHSRGYGRSVLVAMGLMIIFGSAIAVGLYLFRSQRDPAAIVPFNEIVTRRLTTSGANHACSHIAGRQVRGEYSDRRRR